jgi:catechol-2,3-dioxygenase
LVHARPLELQTACRAATVGVKSRSLDGVSKFYGDVLGVSETAPTPVKKMNTKYDPNKRRFIALYPASQD